MLPSAQVKHLFIQKRECKRWSHRRRERVEERIVWTERVCAVWKERVEERIVWKERVSVVWKEREERRGQHSIQGHGGEGAKIREIN
jgi:hypothetical protein